MWLSRACRAAVRLICISLDWKWQEEALILVSLKRTSVPIPKLWCLPRTGHVNSSWPLGWGQGLLVSVLHHISFLTSATKVHCCSGTISGDLTPSTPRVGETPLSLSAHTREAQVVSWKCSLGQISILALLLPPKLLNSPLLGGPSSNHPNSNAEYSLELRWDCYKYRMLRYPQGSGASTLYLAQTRA